MKIVNLQGMTTAERLAYLQEITQDIYNHLYDDFIWTSLSEYTPDGSYSFSALNNFTDGAEVKPYQIVYFSNNGWVALIDQINETAQTFTVINGYQVKGDKGDKGDIGNTGAKGDTGATALECQMIDSTSVPMQYNGVTIEFSKFSRNPVVGEVCNTFVNYASSAIYAVSIRVMTLTNNSANCRYEQVVNFTNILPASAKKQLYTHYIVGSVNTSDNTNIVHFSFSWIDSDNTTFGPNDIISFDSLITALYNRVGTKYFDFFITVETPDGVTTSDTIYCLIDFCRFDTSDSGVKLYVRGVKNFQPVRIGFNLSDFVSSLNSPTVAFEKNAAYKIE